MANVNKTDRLNLIGVYVNCRYTTHVLHSTWTLDNVQMIIIGKYNKKIFAAC